MAYVEHEGTMVWQPDRTVPEYGDPRYRAAEWLAGAVEHFLYSNDPRIQGNIDYLAWAVALYDKAKNGHASAIPGLTEYDPKLAYTRPIPEAEFRAGPNNYQSDMVMYTEGHREFRTHFDGDLEDPVNAKVKAHPEDVFTNDGGDE